MMITILFLKKFVSVIKLEMRISLEIVELEIFSKHYFSAFTRTIPYRTVILARKTEGIIICNLPLMDKQLEH